MASRGIARVSIGFFAAWAGPAVPQSAPADERGIVVTGEREPATSQEVASQARNISIIGDPLHSPLPRFEDRLCPGVVGLTGEAASLVIDRIRQNAERFGLRLARDDGTCQPNMVIAFVPDAQSELATLAREQGYLFAGLSVTERGELFDASQAARVWTSTRTRTRDGMPVASARAAEGAAEVTVGRDEATQAEIKTKLPPVAAMSNAHSRISFPTREDIVSVMILFDQTGVRGRTLLQLADYATMRGFASTRGMRGQPAAPTILSLFDGEGPKPDKLTAFDQAYLTSLYEDLPNIPAMSKLGDVNRHLQRVLVAEAESAAATANE